MHGLYAVRATFAMLCVRCRAGDGPYNSMKRHLPVLTPLRSPRGSNYGDTVLISSDSKLAWNCGDTLLISSD